MHDVVPVRPWGTAPTQACGAPAFYDRVPPGKRRMLANDILHTIGNTPHVRLNRLFGRDHTVYIKSERANPGGSIKDRIALSMVEAAEAAGQLKPGM